MRGFLLLASFAPLFALHCSSGRNLFGEDKLNKIKGFRNAKLNHLALSTRFAGENWLFAATAAATVKIGWQQNKKKV